MISQIGSNFCCGVVEIGNFNYLKDRGPKGMPHYHKSGSGWATQKAAEPTSIKELVQVLNSVTSYSGAVICTTGADQEYMEPLLREVGFCENAFVNRGHEQGEVKFWFLRSADYKKRE